MRYGCCSFNSGELESPIRKIDAALTEIKRRVAERDCSPTSVRKLYRFLCKCEENFTRLLKTLDRLDEERKEEERLEKEEGSLYENL